MTTSYVGLCQSYFIQKLCNQAIQCMQLNSIIIIELIVFTSSIIVLVVHTYDV